MSFNVETEKTDRTKDRKVAGMISFTAFGLLLALLCFIGYRISNPMLSKQLSSEEMTLIPLNPQLLQQGRGGSGDPVKAERSKMTAPQMEQMLAQQSSSSHVQSGNSNSTNTHIPNNNSSNTQHVSDNPFGTGGINGGKYRGKNREGMLDEQDGNPKSEEKINRYLVSVPNTDNIQSDENCAIALSVLIDPDGTIVSNPTFVKNGSTTNDMTLINQVIRAVKSQGRYNKVNTTKNTKQALVIRIMAN